MSRSTEDIAAECSRITEEVAAVAAATQAEVAGDATAADTLDSTTIESKLKTLLEMAEQERDDLRRKMAFVTERLEKAQQLTTQIRDNISKISGRLIYMEREKTALEKQLMMTQQSCDVLKAERDKLQAEVDGGPLVNLNSATETVH